MIIDQIDLRFLEVEFQKVNKQAVWIERILNFDQKEMAPEWCYSVQEWRGRKKWVRWVSRSRDIFSFHWWAIGKRAILSLNFFSHDLYHSLHLSYFFASFWCPLNLKLSVYLFFCHFIWWFCVSKLFHLRISLLACLPYHLVKHLDPDH